jgi:hypothetical protein
VARAHRMGEPVLLDDGSGLYFRKQTREGRRHSSIRLPSSMSFLAMPLQLRGLSQSAAEGHSMTLRTCLGSRHK